MEALQGDKMHLDLVDYNVTHVYTGDVSVCVRNRDSVANVSKEGIS